MTIRDRAFPVATARVWNIYHGRSRHCRHCRLSSVHWRQNCFADHTTMHTSSNSSIDTSLIRDICCGPEVLFETCVAMKFVDDDDDDDELTILRALDVFIAISQFFSCILYEVMLANHVAISVSSVQQQWSTSTISYSKHFKRKSLNSFKWTCQTEDTGVCIINYLLTKHVSIKVAISWHIPASHTSHINCKCSMTSVMSYQHSHNSRRSISMTSAISYQHSHNSQSISMTSVISYQHSHNSQSILLTKKFVCGDIVMW